jgi:hypothetical protein
VNQTPDGDLYAAYHDAIMRRVCSVCLDQRADGTCGLANRTCAIEEHLPLILNAVLSVRSDRMDDYVDAIKTHVCAQCGTEDACGRCRLRDRGECALDTYLYLVVEAIEEVQASQGARL